MACCVMDREVNKTRLITTEGLTEGLMSIIHDHPLGILKQGKVL